MVERVAVAGVDHVEGTIDGIDDQLPPATIVRAGVQMSRSTTFDHDHPVPDLAHQCLHLQRRSRLGRSADQ